MAKYKNVENAKAKQILAESKAKQDSINNLNKPVISSPVASTQVEDHITDPRDGKNYKIVKIGTQTWMAESLDFVTEKGSCCYNNNAPMGLVIRTKQNFCAQYGRLYDYETALKVCPPGWHLPSASEFEELIQASQPKAYNTLVDNLKSSNGFNSLFGGYYDAKRGIFDGLGNHVAYKSSTPGEVMYIDWPQDWHLARSVMVFSTNAGLKDSKAYVRCVKD